ncbi:MAG: SDR family NAD(P)-dependent oxidoreductase [Proteobacteria bacterium]|nr:SDR family NAD(P)-dependent oxidoreductase [Pseudomonadota bacterium]MBU4469350.1 SDR family NAD(P)-dependent oxidoreductase [Pseudomonadota bacterium]MCG2753565.1 SDR family NAD(P)-dependent oxidoreductase [Desulfobacteraceae bacterium]
MFKGQCWWITGASSGIGEALSRALASRGASLILSGRNVAAIEAVARDCPEALVLPFEATDYDSIPGIVERAWSWKGRVEGLANNAGITQRSLAMETAFMVYQKIIAVDLLGPIALTQALLPKMVKAGGGRIIAISSVAGFIGAPLRSAYSAAKHGLIGYHDSVRAENEHLGIHVHVVAPGSVRTNVSKNALAADGSVRGVSDPAIDNGMPPDEAAEAILGAIQEGKREIVLATGMEFDAVALRRKDPEALFDLMSASIRAGYARDMGADSGQG